MYVLIRPGPYVCAEWDFGGHPFWLLNDPKMELRSQYEGYMTNIARYINKVAEIIEPFQINYGGPIIMVQIENEYGYWGTDNSFPIAVLNLWLRTGRIVVPSYTADPPKGLKIGGI
jgi:beta-galactosidase